MQEVDAEDLATDAMLRVCTVTPEGSLRSFYFGAINKMKANPFRQSLRSALNKERYSHEQKACAVPKPDALDMVDTSEMQDMIVDWIKDLSPDETDLLEKHIFQELSFRQIEAKDGTPSSTLSDRWAKVKETQIFVCNVRNDPQSFLNSLKKNLNSTQ